MSSSSVLVYSPFFWSACAGLSLGYAIVRGARRVRRQKGGARLRALKWAKVSVAMSAAVGCALAGVFIPGPERMLDIRLLYMLAGAIVVSVPVFFFPKFGVPVFFFVVVVVLLVDILTLRLWHPVQPVEAFGRFTLLNEDGRYELELPDERSEFGTILEGAVTVDIYRIAVSPYYFHLRPSGYARVASFGSESQAGNRLVFVAEPGSIEQLLASLPGRSLQLIESDPIDPRPLYVYEIMLVDGDVKVALRPPER